MQDDVHVLRLRSKIEEIDQKIEELRRHKHALQLLIDDTSVRLVVASAMGSPEFQAPASSPVPQPQAEPYTQPRVQEQPRSQAVAAPVAQIPTRLPSSPSPQAPQAFLQGENGSPLVQSTAAPQLRGHQIP